MSDRCDLARGWLLKARSDLNACRRMLETDGPYDTSCFHAQQVIEKSLKALLAFHGQPVPRTHDLEELQRLCSSLQALPALARYDFSETTDYGVLVRYDLEFWPDQSTASDAVTQAEQVFDLVVNTLPPECRP
jgi:HEPN domain-containing protein